MRLFPDTSDAVQPNASKIVIEGMKRLLRIRYRKSIDRKEFLRRWYGLRVVLKWTPEYQRMLRAVFARDRVCVLCGKRPATDPHHKIPVAFAPHLSCDPRNVQGICRECHIAQHKTHSSDGTEPHPTPYRKARSSPQAREARIQSQRAAS